MVALPKILDSSVVCESRLFTIQKIGIKFSNGQLADYERLIGNGRGAGAVMIIPVLADSKILLVREYAAGVERYELGFVKGLIEEGESPLDAAHRELREEIGQDANLLEQLATTSITPSYSDFKTHIFIARDLFVSPLVGDEPEKLEILTWPLDSLSELRNRDDFSDSRSQLATYLVAEKLKL